MNYGWAWDLGAGLAKLREDGGAPDPRRALASAVIPRVELIVRWGGRRRLSGFLPVQCAYADFMVVDTLWPDMRADELLQALAWYQEQDVTLGG